MVVLTKQNGGGGGEAKVGWVLYVRTVVIKRCTAGSVGSGVITSAESSW